MRKIVVGMRKMKNWKWECGKLEWKRKEREEPRCECSNFAIFPKK